MRLGDFKWVVASGAERPASLFVAGFIGSPAMNFLPAKTAGAGNVTLANGAALACPNETAADVTLGVRPEHLDAADDGPIKLQASLSEQLGAATLIHGVLAGTDVELTASLPGIQHVEEGATLSFAAAPEALHLFGKESGRRL